MRRNIGSICRYYKFPGKIFNVQIQMANLASLFAMPLALVAEDVKENQKKLAQTEANQKESNTENGSTKPAEVEVPSATGEIKLTNDHREVAGNKTSPKKKKKKKQNKRIQIHEYIDYDKKTAEEAHLLDSSQWMWNGASTSAARNHESEPPSSSQREVVCYEELMNPRIFRKNARWRGRPDPGQERPNNGSASTSLNGLQSVPHSNEAPSPNNIESVTRMETVPVGVESSNLSSAGSEKKVREYVDYDKKLVEDAEMHDPFARGWTDVAASAASNHVNGPKSSSHQREIISYEELFRSRNSNNRSRGGRGRGQNYHMVPHNVNNGVPVGAFKRPSNYNGPPNKIPRLNGGELIARNNIPTLMPMMPCGFIDPNVAATEKEEIFEKLQPVNVNPNARKPLSNKQRKKIEKAKFYKEKLRQQLEKEKDRVSVQKKLQCRFFSYGNCTKGDECPFSHDFVPQKKPELCKFYIMSVCEKGPSCIYYHNDWPCKFFHVFRSCTQGDACRFSHQPLTDETRPLLEKSLNDGIPNCGSSSTPSDLSQPMNGPNLPPVTTINETPRILGENGPAPIPFYGAENLRHTQTIPGQMPLANNDLGFDPIHQEPWNKTLEPIDLDESHCPHLPSGVESSNPTFLQDPRMERYRTTGRPSERSVIRGNALDISASVVNGFDRDSCSDDSKFFASSSEQKSTRDSFVCDSMKTFSSSEGVFSASRGTFADSMAKSKELFSSSCSSSSLLLSTSGLGNARSDELKLQTARHFSLPLTRHATRGIGDGRLARNRAAGMVTTASTGPTDPALRQSPSFN